MDFEQLFADSLTAGIIVLILMLIVMVGLTALWIWVLYTIIWRAVRRGLREFYGYPRDH